MAILGSLRLAGAQVWAICCSRQEIAGQMTAQEIRLKMFDRADAEVSTKLMTIGYEGSAIGDFVATLKSAGVKTLIDVRELPLSRKKGFSKRALSEALEAANIRYRHVKQLGDPKPGRDAARSGDMDAFRRIFGAHMELDATKSALYEIVPLVLEGGACLMCFERCHRDCHRAIVGKHLESLAKIELAHIGVQKGIEQPQ